MTDRQPAKHRNAQPAEPFHQHMGRADGATGVGCGGELAHRDTGQLLEDAAVAQMSQHAVNPIRRLVDLFYQQDRPAHVRHERRADRGVENAQVTAQQQALSTAGGSDPGRW